MANKPAHPLAIGNELSTTLASQISPSDTTLTVASAVGFNPDGGYILVDEGTSSEEAMYVESVSGNILTVATNGRGLAGTSAVLHNVGATITDILVDDHVNGPRGAFLLEHNDDGTHKQITGDITLSGTVANVDNRVVDKEGLDIYTNLRLIEGYLVNGKIEVSVSSNNITVALKTFAGADPSAGDKIQVLIDGTVREITSALTVTIAAGAQKFGAGLPILAGKSVDLFVFLAWRAASSAVVIGLSRKPMGRIYSDWSATAITQNYIEFNVAPASDDTVVNIGRVSAQNSGAASFNWSIGAVNHIHQGRITKTRKLTFLPDVFLDSGTGTLPSYTAVDVGDYLIDGHIGIAYIAKNNSSGGTAGSGTGIIGINLPFLIDYQSTVMPLGPGIIQNGTAELAQMIKAGSVDDGARIQNGTLAVLSCGGQNNAARRIGGMITAPIK